MSQPENETAHRALSIAAAMAATSPGEKADARRMGPEGSAFFWRQVARLGIAPSEEASWLLFTRLVALMTPAIRKESINEVGRHLGAVLADGGDRHKPLNTPDARPFLSEARLARFLAARGAARIDALERIVRMLARRGPSLDVETLAFAAMVQRDDRLAANFYRRIDQSPKKEPQDE